MSLERFILSPEERKKLEAKREANKVYTGSIELYRDIQNTELWKSGDGNLLKVYVFCLLRANNRPKAVSKKYLEKYMAWVGHGQFVTGRRAGGKNCGMSENTFKKNLQKLEQMGFISQEIRKLNRIISVNFWNAPFTESNEAPKPE